MDKNVQAKTQAEKLGSDYEAKILQLQKIVDTLESDVSLEEGMKLFEQGLALTKECMDDLNATQARIAELKKQLDIISVQSVFGDGDE
ncbi:MAG: exodeoxyribonuclease VII small subunit [Roseburia sp.]|nr:exodeoxyribonuclease VII small subunit [Roseburia sp.]